MRRRQYPCINLADAYTPLAVWGFSLEGWQFVKVERPAIAIANCAPPFKLVFPSHVKPEESEKISAKIFFFRSRRCRESKTLI
ncbi:MAG: hypothetical protein HC820_00390 [Hydrococcus sp. RM1_1_31]|nr:hypothetical protein [Hydrococcus sp. RM1_1_31]